MSGFEHPRAFFSKAAVEFSKGRSDCLEYCQRRGLSTEDAETVTDVLERCTDALGDGNLRPPESRPTDRNETKTQHTEPTTMVTTDDLLENAEMNCKMINQLAMSLNEDSTIENEVVPRDGLPQRTTASFFGIDKVAPTSSKKEASSDLSNKKRAEKLIAQNTENLARLTGNL